MREISFSRVVEIWRAAGGKNTGGILAWFEPPTTTAWLEGKIRADETADLRFIGGDPESQWGALTKGTYVVRDAAPVEPPSPMFRWDPSWHLVTIRDPENGRRTIIDGNTRAHQLHHALRSGQVSADTEIALISGDLDLLLVRIGKSVSSLWR